MTFDSKSKKRHGYYHGHQLGSADSSSKFAGFIIKWLIDSPCIIFENLTESKEMVIFMARFHEVAE